MASSPAADRGGLTKTLISYRPGGAAMARVDARFRSLSPLAAAPCWAPTVALKSSDGGRLAALAPTPGRARVRARCRRPPDARWARTDEVTWSGPASRRSRLQTVQPGSRDGGPHRQARAPASALRAGARRSRDRGGGATHDAERRDARREPPGERQGHQGARGVLLGARASPSRGGAERCAGSARAAGAPRLRCRRADRADGAGHGRRRPRREPVLFG